MLLDNSPDRFDAATRDELDRAVNDAVQVLLGDVSVLNSILQYGLLLNAIIGHSNDHLDTKYLGMQHAKKLIDTHGELRGMLDSAWESKSYREIRELG